MGSLSFSLQGGVDHGLPAPLNGAGSPDPSDNQWRRGPERKMRAVHQMKQSPFLAGVPAPRARSCCSLTLLPVHPRKFIAIKPVPLNRVFHMLARLGDVIYSVGCIAAAAILGLGIFDYWFGQGGLVALISWVVLAAGLWLIGEAIRYILTARW